MSRNGVGQFNLINNTWFPPVAGVLATAGDWEILISDIAAALTQSVSKDGQTPITGNLNMGGNKLTNLGAGTGTGQTLRWEQLFDQGVEADIPSAATTDIGAQTSNFLRVTGTTTITSFGTNYKGPRFLRFANAVTLTNSSTLILPGGVNYTTSPGDVIVALPKATLGTADGWYVVAPSIINNAVVNGSLTLNSGTANGVAYLNGSKVLTTGTGLQFDGSNLGLGVTPSAWSTNGNTAALQLKNNTAGGSSNGGSALATWFGSVNLMNNSFFNSAGNMIYIAADKASRYSQYDGQHQWFTAPSGTAGNSISFTQAMTLDASGRLGIGTTSPQAPLHVRVGSNQNIYLDSSGGVARITAVNDALTDNIDLIVQGERLIFTTDGAERARIDSSGNLLVGCTSVPSASVFGARIGTPGGTYWTSSANTTASYGHMAFANTNGFVGFITTSGSSTSYVTSSDYRLKENIQPMTGALAKVALLKPCTYKWKADGSDGEGFIAHELQAVVPQCVTGEKDAVDKEGKPVYQGIDTSFLVGTLTAAIKELKAIVDAQGAEIAALKAKA